MKRFVKVYLTLLILAILAVNLVAVIIYGHQFFFAASEGSTLTVMGVASTTIWLNAGVLGVFIVLWLVARHIYQQNQRNHTKY